MTGARGGIKNEKKYQVYDPSGDDCRTLCCFSCGLCAHFLWSAADPDCRNAVGLAFLYAGGGAGAVYRLGNILGGADILDIVFGSLTTLAAAALAYRLRANRYLVPVPAVVLNALVVPFILRYAYQVPDAFYFMVFTVGAGQFISAQLLGIILLLTLEKIGFGKFFSLEKAS